MHKYFTLVKDQIYAIFFIGSCYKATGSCRTNALFGFHTFIGCDQTGRFMGKSKTFRWKTFANADDNILNAPGDVSKNCLLSLMYVIFF